MDIRRCSMIAAIFGFILTIVYAFGLLFMASDLDVPSNICANLFTDIQIGIWVTIVLAGSFLFVAGMYHLRRFVHASIVFGILTICFTIIVITMKMNSTSITCEDQDIVNLHHINFDVMVFYLAMCSLGTICSCVCFANNDCCNENPGEAALRETQRHDMV